MRRLLAVCPKNTGGTNGVFRVDQRGLDAVVALGIYHLESGLKASVIYGCILFNLLYFRQQLSAKAFYFQSVSP